MDKDEGEDDHAEHHREGRRVVREGTANESLVLRVLERADRHLCGGKQLRMPYIFRQELLYPLTALIENVGFAPKKTGLFTSLERKMMLANSLK